MGIRCTTKLTLNNKKFLVMKHICMIMWMSCMGVSKLVAGGLVEGTLIKVADGYRKVETLSVGDRVLTCGVQGKCTEEVILAIRTKQATLLTQVTIEDEELIVDPTHKFYVSSSAHCMASKDLRPGQKVLNARNNSVVGAVHTFQTERAVNLVDFSVARNHNFYVSERDVLVHNFGFVISIPLGSLLAGEGISLGAVLTASATATAVMNADAALRWLEDRSNNRDRHPDNSHTQPADEDTSGDTLRQQAILSVVRGEASWETLARQEGTSSVVIDITLEDLIQGCKHHAKDPQRLQAWASFLTEHEHLVSLNNIIAHPQGEAIMEVLHKAAKGEFSLETPGKSIGKSPLHAAVENRDPATIIALLDEGADIEASDCTIS
jgi:hypothetical protein